MKHSELSFLQRICCELVFFQVELKEILPLYQLAIDWAIANVPSKVDAVFERAMLVSCPEVSSEIRCIRLKLVNKF